MRTVCIFVSSPNDTLEERCHVSRVVERLNCAFQDSVHLEAVRGESRFYTAHGGFQPQIPRSGKCDFILAMRGSPLRSLGASELRYTKVFFGRTHEVARAAAKLQLTAGHETPFQFAVGLRKVGKSSFVHAKGDDAGRILRGVSQKSVTMLAIYVFVRTIKALH